MNKVVFKTLTEINGLSEPLDLNDIAENYLTSFDWCLNITNSWYDHTVSFDDKIGVFLFEIIPVNDQVDDYIWVVVGDLPFAYLDKSVKSGNEALEIYCDLMQDWSDNALAGKSVDECFPIPNEATKENAELLKSRIDFIREEIIG